MWCTSSWYFFLYYLVISMLFSALDFIILNDNIADMPGHSWKSFFGSNVRSTTQKIEYLNAFFSGSSNPSFVFRSQTLPGGYICFHLFGV